MLHAIIFRYDATCRPRLPADILRDAAAYGLHTLAPMPLTPYRYAVEDLSPVAA